jgi:hypothetical protein
MPSRTARSSAAEGGRFGGGLEVSGGISCKRDCGGGREVRRWTGGKETPPASTAIAAEGGRFGGGLEGGQIHAGSVVTRRRAGGSEVDWRRLRTELNLVYGLELRAMLITAALEEWAQLMVDVDDTERWLCLQSILKTLSETQWKAWESVMETEYQRTLLARLRQAVTVREPGAES